MKLTRMNEVGVDRDEPVRLEVHEDADDWHFDHQLEDQDGVDDGKTYLKNFHLWLRGKFSICLFCMTA